VATAAEEAYPVKIDRPAKVGDVPCHDTEQESEYVSMDKEA